MKLQEIKNNPEIMAHLRWDLTPQNSGFPNGTWEVNSQADIDAMNQFLKTREGYYFYVDVYDCQARLALMQNTVTGAGTMHAIEDFESALLEKAVYQVGGSITTSGWYPLSRQLISLLKKKLGVA
jgi:hypothetical protein